MALDPDAPARGRRAAGGRHLPPPFPAGVDEADVLGRRRTAAVRCFTAATAPASARRRSTRRADARAQARPQPGGADRVRALSARCSATPSGWPSATSTWCACPGPWDGPVRVIASDEHVVSPGHADGPPRGRPDRVPGAARRRRWCSRSSPGRAAPIASPTCSTTGSRMAKEVQLHMWISFLEGVADARRRAHDRRHRHRHAPVDDAFPDANAMTDRWHPPPAGRARPTSRSTTTRTRSTSSSRPTGGTSTTAASRCPPSRRASRSPGAAGRSRSG